MSQEIESKYNLPKASDAKNNKEVIYQLVSAFAVGRDAAMSRPRTAWRPSMLCIVCPEFCPAAVSTCTVRRF